MRKNRALAGVGGREDMIVREVLEIENGGCGGGGGGGRVGIQGH